MRRFTPKQLLNRTERKNVKTLAFRTCLIVLVLALIWRNRYTLALVIFAFCVLGLILLADWFSRRKGALGARCTLGNPDPGKPVGTKKVK